MIDSSGKCSVCGMVMPPDGITLHSCGGVRTFPGGGTMTDTTQWTHDAAAWKARAERAERQAADLKEQKDAAYHERDQIVALLARMALALGCRAGIRPHEPNPDPTWDDDWKNVVVIDLPTGQVTWHYHDSERPLFASLPPYLNSWDGHDTSEKYHRVAAAYREGR